MNDINKRYNLGMSIQDKYNSKTMRIILNDWINYYNQYLKINNNQGVKAMKTIYSKISSIINNTFEKIGYFFIGYKVDIKQNQSALSYAKYGIKALRDTQSHNIDDIKVIQKYKIGLHEFEELKKEVEAVKDTLNKLRRDCAKQKKTPTKNKVNELLFTTNNKMLNDCSRELINFVLDANEYDDKVDIKDVNNILRKHINLTNERGQDGTK